MSSGVPSLPQRRARAQAVVPARHVTPVTDVALCRDVAGRHGVDADAVRAELSRERVHEADQAGFRGRIRRQAVARERVGRGRERDRAVSAGAPEARQRRAQRDPGRDEVELDRRAEHRERQLRHVRAGLLLGERATGDRDDVLDREAGRFGVRERSHHGILVGEVDRVRGHVLPPDGNAVECDHAISARDERAHQGAAEAAGGAGDEDDAHSAGRETMISTCARTKRW